MLFATDVSTVRPYAATDSNPVKDKNWLGAMFGLTPGPGHILNLPLSMPTESNSLFQAASAVRIFAGEDAESKVHNRILIAPVLLTSLGALTG